MQVRPNLSKRPARLQSLPGATSELAPPLMQPIVPALVRLRCPSRSRCQVEYGPMHCHRPPEPAHAVTALVRGEHPLQGTEGRSEAGHHPFQRKSIEVLVLNTQRVCQVSILLLYYCKFHPRGLQSLADLTFCSHVLSLTCDPSCPS